MDLLELMMELDIQHCLAQKYVKLFTTELDTLYRSLKSVTSHIFFLNTLQKSKLKPLTFCF